MANGEYIAVPASGSGPGVLVLHAWWGLTDVFRGACDRLADAGFVALAPDLYDGATTASIAEAEQLSQRLDDAATRATILDALYHLRAHPGVRDTPVGVIGFSLGAFYAYWLSTERPDAVAAVVVYYGTGDPGADYTRARAAYLGHYATLDPYEPEEGVRQLEMALRAGGREVSFHTYPGTGHWFAEDNRPDAYNADAAALAWERTLAFLREHLKTTQTKGS
jgi:carboxymethylenebutenolidase